jgi:DnaJ-class molecular chaperone
MDLREPPYDPHQCPLCTPKPGVCNDCRGSGRCTFCNGTGTRKTSTRSLASEKINDVTYKEKCPYCGGTGVCRYCQGSGTCWACNATGRVEDWSFLEGKPRQAAPEQPADTAAGKKAD